MNSDFNPDIYSMSMNEYQYQFPEKNPFRAKELSEPTFNIQNNKSIFERLWVDFNSIRSNRFAAEMKYTMGMNPDTNHIENNPNTYSKILFSGHRGSGKSVELRRFQQEVDSPNGFWTLFVDIEEVTEPQRLEPEDLFVIITTLLVEKLQKEEIPLDTQLFEDIAEEWVQDEQVEKELKNEYGMEAGAEASLGFKFWTFLGAKGNLKGVYTQNNTTTRTIRQKVKINQKSLIEKLNVALISLRQKLLLQRRGRDILIIIDGFEKARSSTYESLYVKDTQLIHDLGAHLICSVPINTYYEILHMTALDFYKPVYLPMLRVNDRSIPFLKEMITRRIHEDLFEENVLDQFVQFSGGCPRQLLKLVNGALVNSLGKEIDKDIAEETLTEQANERWKGLTSKHKEILESGDFESADKE